MADEQKLDLSQALRAGPPAPTPSDVGMDEVKAILQALDTESVTGTGKLYVETAEKLVKHADNLVAHAEALADIWRGPNAELSLETLKKLHGAVTTISANASTAGQTYQWLGNTILPFYKDSGRTMKAGLIHTDGDDERARELLDRLNSRLAEANNGLPSQLTVVFPEVDALAPPHKEGTPGPGARVPQPYAPTGPGGQPPAGFGNPEIPPGPGGQTPPVPNGPGGGGPGGGGPGGSGGPGGQTPQVPNLPEVPPGPGGQTPAPIGPGGNNTDLAGAQPPVGAGPNPFNLTPAAPAVPGGPPVAPGGPGPFNVPAGPGPLVTPIGPGGARPPVLAGPGGLGGPNAVVSRAPSAVPPRTALGQGVPGVIGADRGMGASARGGMMLGGARGGGTADGGEEHLRSTWLSEDEDVWGADADVPPPVIG